MELKENSEKVNFENVLISNSSIDGKLLEKRGVSLRIKLKIISEQWILNSATNAMANILKKNLLYLKIFWGICFLAGTTMGLYTTIKYLITFLSFGVSVSTLNVIESPAKFPAVTVCNLNPFNKNRSAQFFTGVLNGTIFSNTSSLMQMNMSARDVTYDLLDTLKVDASANPQYNQDKKTYGFYISEMLTSCNYIGTDCSTSDFLYLQSYDYGNCYTFNGNTSKIQTVSSAGPGNSLQIELFSGDPNDELYVASRGFYVIVHNQSYTPIMDNEGVYVSVGTETNIGVERSFYSKQSSPYSSCIDDPTSSSSSTSTLYQLILNALGEKRYRQSYCYKLCYQIAVVNNCSCYDAAYPNTNITNKDILACHESQQIKCLDTIKTWFSTNGFTSSCDSYCPIECLAVTYKKSIHFSQYPTNSYLSLLRQQTGFTSKYSTYTQNSADFNSYIKSSVAKINVFYSDISYIALIESPTITWDVLMGNIGGTFGLFIGISLMNILELFEISSEIIRTIYYHRKEKNLINVS